MYMALLSEQMQHFAELGEGLLVHVWLRHFTSQHAVDHSYCTKHCSAQKTASSTTTVFQPCLLQRENSVNMNARSCVFVSALLCTWLAVAVLCERESVWTGSETDLYKSALWEPQFGNVIIIRDGTKFYYLVFLA